MFVCLVVQPCLLLLLLHICCLLFVWIELIRLISAYVRLMMFLWNWHKSICPCFSIEGWGAHWSWFLTIYKVSNLVDTEVSKSLKGITGVFNPIIMISIDSVMTIGFKSKNNQFALIYLLYYYFLFRVYLKWYLNSVMIGFYNKFSHHPIDGSAGLNQ